MAPTNYISFVVRLWCVKTSVDAPGWQAEIEHIQTGGHWTFDTVEELLDFLRQQAKEQKEVTQSPRNLPG